MSATVFLIAAAHAIPVIIGRIVGGRQGAFTAAFFTFLFAGFVGGLRYAIFDFAAIAIALYICWNVGDKI
jgi:hypothetical protein